MFGSRIKDWLSRQKVEEEFSTELGAHLELLTEENMRRGMTRGDAERAAKIKLGGASQLSQTNREQRGLPVLETFFQDLRFAIRGLQKSPGFALVCTLTLALGIGANTAIFSVINAVLLQQMPFPQPDRVVVIHRHESSSIPYAEFLDLQAQTKSFELLALHRFDNMNLTSAGEPERELVRMCSPDFFTILGMRPILGRTFVKEEDRLAADQVIVLSESLWRRKFNGDPKIVGSSATLAGRGYTILGVLPDLPRQFANSDVFLPIGQWSEPTFRLRGEGFGAVGLARIKTGVTMEQARADLTQVAKTLALAYPKDDAELGFTALPFRTYSTGNEQQPLLLLFGAVGLVLLIACANVANLLLARSTKRKRELAIRVAMGAGRGRVVRQLLTETCLLALVGGLLGLLLAVWAKQAMMTVAPAGFLDAQGGSLNVRMLLFTGVLSLLTGVLFGIIPALKAARVDVQETLKEGGRGSTGRQQRAQSALVVAEIALAFVLLAGAGLLVRSLARVWEVNPGYDPRNVLTFVVAPSPQTASDGQKLREMYDRLIERLEALPGADSASVAFGNLPLTGESDIEFWREDRPRPEKMTDAPDALWFAVMPDYLRVMRIPLLRGRFITAQDAETSQDVVVINDAIARKVFPNEDPLGKHIYLHFFEQSAEIVGVTGTIKDFGLDTPPDKDNELQMYLPFRQVPDRLMALLAKNSRLALRSVVPPGSMAKGVREAVRAVDSQQVMFEETTMEALVEGSTAFRRFSLTLLAIFAALALLLASIGTYGVISNLVGQNMHEFGVRLALGAQPGDVLRLVLRRGLRLDLAGIVIGIGGGLPLMQLLSSQLFGVAPWDPVTFVGAAILLSGMALLACFIPAHRATRVDPVVTLRYE